MGFRLVLIAATLCLTSCETAPDGYPPPTQRPLPEAAEQNPIGKFVRMNDEFADLHILGDIRNAPEGSGWRWTFPHPALRFVLDRTEGQKFAIDFAFPEPNFRDTGPVTVSFFINGKLLDKVRYTTPGDKHFEKAVPAAWLRAGPYTEFRADIDPPWIAPTDKVKLGFVLHRAGFVE